MESLRQDIRIALRALRRAPGFTALAVTALATGIGANAAFFPFLLGIATNPLGFEEPEELVYIDAYAPERNLDLAVSYPDFVEWRERNRTLEGVVAYQTTGFALSGSEAPEQVQGTLVSHSLTQLLRAPPLHGRGFLPEDDEEGAPGVALLGFGLWRRRYGGDPAAVGNTIIVDGEQVTIVGIMPSDFWFPSFAEIWMPLRLSPLRGLGNFSYQAVGRLLPGVSVEAAEVDLRAISEDISRRFPVTNGDVTVRLAGLTETYVGGTREIVVIFYVVVTLLLLLACANVANLMVARATVRQREMAIRASLGAGKSRLARMAFTECVILALVGGALGIGLGAAGRDLMIAGVPFPVPYYALYDLDPQSTLWMVALILGCGFLFGLAPAGLGARVSVSRSLQWSGGLSDGVSLGRFRSSLAAFQVGMAVVVLVGAGLSIRSMVRMRSIDPGFETSGLLTMRLGLPEADYPIREQREVFFRNLVARIRSLPGVTEASAASNLPMGRSNWGTRYYVEGTEPPPPGQYATAEHGVVLPGYFQALGIPVLRGRDFDEGDMAEGAPPVVIVNRQLAERWWPDSDPMGRRIRYSVEARDSDSWMEVVGVVENVLQYGLRFGVREGMYRPHAQLPTPGMSLVIKTSGDPLAVVDPVREVVWAMDSRIPPYSIRTMERVVQEGNGVPSVFSWLFGVFSAVAVVLATVGVYGVVAYSVVRRGREFGIRMALGAGPRRVVAEVLGQGVRLTGIGLAAGVLVALAGMRFAEGVFFGVNPRDPAVYLITTAAMGLVALLATFLPARGATRVDPAEALRSE